MPSLEIAIVCIVPLVMMLQKWASKPSVTPSARQHENGQPVSQDAKKRQNASNPKELSQGIVQSVAGAPLDIQVLVAQQLSNSDVASVSLVCRDAHEALWNSESVWSTLAAQANLPVGRSGVAKYTRDSYRREAYRIDCGELAVLADAPEANADSNLFNEASHVVKGLMADDTNEIQALFKIMVPALESLNFAAAGSAEAFLRQVRKRKDLFSKEDLEMLDGAYDYALMQHNLMMDTIEDHDHDWEMQMQSFEQQVCEYHRSLILD